MSLAIIKESVLRAFRSQEKADLAESLEWMDKEIDRVQGVILGLDDYGAYYTWDGQQWRDRLLHLQRLRRLVIEKVGKVKIKTPQL